MYLTICLVMKYTPVVQAQDVSARQESMKSPENTGEIWRHMLPTEIDKPQ